MAIQKNQSAEKPSQVKRTIFFAHLNRSLNTLILIGLTLSGCASSGYEVVQKLDKLEGARRTFMVGNLLLAGEDAAPPDEELYLNALRLDWRTGETVYYLVARYNFSQWLKIKRGEALTLFIDGRQINLWGEGSAAKRTTTADPDGGEYQTEQAWFQVTVQQLFDIVEGRNIQIALAGEKRKIMRSFSHRNKIRFNKFVRKHVDSKASEVWLIRKNENK